MAFRLALTSVKLVSTSCLTKLLHYQRATRVSGTYRIYTLLRSYTSSAMPQKCIIDVDTGVDDAQAIMLALSKPDIQVLGITCVAGNCNVNQVCINTLKVLTACDRLDIPVYKGASTALVGEGLEATHYHGSDGLGDNSLDIQVSMEQIQKEVAVNALVRLVNEHPGEITLVALAPLTNIAMAIRQDPEFGKKLKSVTIMGGNVEGKGNSTVCGEFNFASDPDAAFVVLNELGIMIDLHCWEINLTSATGQPWDWFDKWVETDSKKGRFNKSIVQVAVEKQRQVRKMPIYRSCDLNAMLTVVAPEVVDERTEVWATVELQGKYTRGMMVVDWNSRLGNKPNVKLIRKIDTAQARGHFEKMLL